MRNIGYMFLNGLGTGETKWHENIMLKTWHRAGVDLVPAHINYYAHSSDELIDQVCTLARTMLKSHDGVAFVSESAGGSLALNALHILQDESVCAVIAHGRMRAGDLPRSNRNSLYRRAHLDTDSPATGFYEGVLKAEKTALALSADEKRRILILTQLTDMVVPLSTMTLPGVQTHRSIALGHTGAFFAHLIGNRDRIMAFAHQTLERKV